MILLQFKAASVYQSLWGTWGISKPPLTLSHKQKLFGVVCQSFWRVLCIYFCRLQPGALGGTLGAFTYAQAETWMTKLLGDNYIYFRHCGLQYCFFLSCLFVSWVTPNRGGYSYLWNQESFLAEFRTRWDAGDQTRVGRASKASKAP